jgi:alpha-galactosidase
MLPEVKLAIAFTCLTIVTLGILFYVSSYIGYLAHCVVTQVFVGSFADTNLDAFVYFVCQAVAYFPVVRWLHGIYLVFQNKKSQEHPQVVRPVRMQDGPDWIDRTSRIEFEQLADGRLALAGLLHSPVPVNPAVVFCLGDDGAKGSWVLFCCRCRGGERTLKWSDVPAETKDIAKDGSRIRFADEAAGLEVCMTLTGLKHGLSSNGVALTATLKLMQSNNADAPPTSVYIKHVRLTFNFAQSREFTRLEDINVLQNGFGTFARSLSMAASEFCLQPLANLPVWRYLVGGVGMNADGPFFENYRRGLFSDHYIGFDSMVVRRGHNDSRTGLFIGYESQLKGLGSFFFEPGRKRLYADLEYGTSLRQAGSLAAEPLWLLKTNLAEGTTALETFANAVADKHGVQFRARAISTDARSVPLGWCSWYEFYADVTEEKVLRNVKLLAREDAKVKVDFIQLDDGYQRHIGDWLTVVESKFPHGLKGLARSIRSHGFQAGIWVAPFLAGANSEVFRQHKDDWFVKERPGLRETGIVAYAFNILRYFGLNPASYTEWPANVLAHYNPEWGSDVGVQYLLDYTHPEVQAHITHVFRTLKSYGFEYFKIDFLTAGIRDGQRYDSSVTRLEAYRNALVLIREAVGPDAFVLGCGAPLAPTVGLVDGFRVSGDIKELWEPNIVENFCAGNVISVPSLKQSLVMNMRRNFLHGIWWLNDPDCLLVREDPRFTLTEAKTAVSLLGMTGGILLLSDDMSNVSPSRLDLVTRILPSSTILKASPDSLVEKNYPDVFVCRSFCPGRDADVHAFINWSDEEGGTVRDVRRHFPQGSVDNLYCFDFWREEVVTGEMARALAFEKHETRVIISTRRSLSSPVLIGNSFHILAQSDGRIQGVWSAKDSTLTIGVEDVSAPSGKFWVCFPHTSETIAMEAESFLTSCDGRKMVSIIKSSLVHLDSSMSATVLELCVADDGSGCRGMSTYWTVTVRKR